MTSLVAALAVAVACPGRDLQPERQIEFLRDQQRDLRPPDGGEP